MSETAELVQTFRFAVTLTAASGPRPATPSTLGDGYFAECSGLELEADIKEHLEGGRNDGVVRRVGRVKLSPIVLKRGMFVPATGQPADAGPEGGSNNAVGKILGQALDRRAADTGPVERFGIAADNARDGDAA